MYVVMCVKQGGGGSSVVCSLKRHPKDSKT